MVRLEALLEQFFKGVSRYFNSSMVRLEEKNDDLGNFWKVDFNSSMVRLEASPGSAVVMSGKVFQFQHGTIRSGCVAFKKLLLNGFQFQHGTIRSIPERQKELNSDEISIPAWYD